MRSERYVPEPTPRTSKPPIVQALTRRTRKGARISPPHVGGCTAWPEAASPARSDAKLTQVGDTWQVAGLLTVVQHGDTKPEVPPADVGRSCRTDVIDREQ